MILFLLTTLPFESRTPFNWDAAQFVLGVQHFSVAMHQPHPPGYPLFIASGKLLASAGLSPHTALLVVSGLFAAAAVVGMYLLVWNIWVHRGVALVAAATFMVNPIFWLYRETALTYTIDACIGIILALCTHYVVKLHSIQYAYISGIVLGIASGFRPSISVFFAPFILLQWLYIRRMEIILKTSICLIVSYLIWFIPLAGLSGGLLSYYNLVSHQFEASAKDTSLLHSTSFDKVIQNILRIKDVLISSVNVVGIFLGVAIIAYVARIFKTADEKVDIFFILLGLAWSTVSVFTYGFVHFGQVGYILTILPLGYLVAAAGLQWLVCRSRSVTKIWIGPMCWVIASGTTAAHAMVFLLLSPTMSSQLQVSGNSTGSLTTFVYKNMAPMAHFNRAYLQLKDQQLIALENIVGQFDPAEAVVITAWGVYPSPPAGIFNEDLLRRFSALSPQYLVILAHAHAPLQLIQRSFLTMSKRDTAIVLPATVKYAIFSLDGLPPEDMPHPASLEPRYANMYEKPFFAGAITQPLTFLQYTIYRKHISTLDAFVRGLFQSVLGRTPSTDDVSAWIASLETVPVSAMIHTFFAGPEYQGRPITPWTHVAALFQGILGRDPDPRGREWWVNHVRERYKMVLTEFMESSEFRHLRPDCGDPRAVTTWVIHLYQHALDRIPGVLERQRWIDDVMAHCNIQETAAAFFSADEYESVPRTLTQHVIILHRSLLAREPSTEEVAYWVGRLVRQFQAIEETFISSAEFQARFHHLFQ
jgi:hypothetical protein